MSVCTHCTGNDNTGHEASCLATWKNPKWLNREMIWHHRGDCWIWRELKNVTPAKVVKVPTGDGGGSLNLRDISKDDTEMDAKWDRAMQNWTDEEVEDLLGR